MSDHQLSVFQSGIRDNHDRGTVGDFLKDKIEPGSKLSIVSAYFTIYAFEALKQEERGVRLRLTRKNKGGGKVDQKWKIHLHRKW